MNQEVIPPKESPVFGVLSTVNRGEFLPDTEDAIRQVVNATRDYGGKGKVSVELSFEYDQETGATKVSAELKVKKPASPRRASLFFPTPEGNLQRDDPRQQRLFAGDQD